MEDYLLVPRIIGRTVKVPAVVALVAVLVGGALLGIVGALVAILVAAALRLLMEEIMFRRLDRSLTRPPGRRGGTGPPSRPALA